jgi:hypothetical protein
MSTVPSRFQPIVMSLITKPYEPGQFISYKQQISLLFSFQKSEERAGFMLVPGLLLTKENKHCSLDRPFSNLMRMTNPSFVWLFCLVRRKTHIPESQVHCHTDIALSNHSLAKGEHI